MRNIIIASAAVMLIGMSAAAAQAGHPNFHRVYEKSNEAYQQAQELFTLTAQIPTSYGQLRQQIRIASYIAQSRTRQVFQIAESIEQGTYEGSEWRENMLQKARYAKKFADKCEELARQIKRQADRDDDDATEDLARQLRRQADRVEDRMRCVVHELD